MSLMRQRASAQRQNRLRLLRIPQRVHAAVAIRELSGRPLTRKACHPTKKTVQTMTEATFNNLLQWGCVAVIIIVAAIVIIRKARRFSRHLKNDGPTDCSCGCNGCTVANCPLPRKEVRNKKLEGISKK